MRVHSTFFTMSNLGWLRSGQIPTAAAVKMVGAVVAGAAAAPAAGAGGGSSSQFMLTLHVVWTRALAEVTFFSLRDPLEWTSVNQVVALNFSGCQAQTWDWGRMQ